MNPKNTPEYQAAMIQIEADREMRERLLAAEALEIVAEPLAQISHL